MTRSGRAAESPTRTGMRPIIRPTPGATVQSAGSCNASGSGSASLYFVRWITKQLRDRVRIRRGADRVMCSQVSSGTTDGWRTDRLLKGCFSLVGAWCLKRPRYGSGTPLR